MIKTGMFQQSGYRETRWPPVRDLVLGFLWQHKPNTFYGFGEVDVTEALAAIRRYQRLVRIAVSFHAFVMFCLAQAAHEHPVTTTYRRRRRLITFDDVDLFTLLENRLPDGVRIPAGYIVRAANRKSLAEINWEIRRVARSDLAGQLSTSTRGLTPRLPEFFRRAIRLRVARNPFRLRDEYGTMAITNLQVPIFIGLSSACRPISSRSHWHSAALSMPLFLMVGDSRLSARRYA